MQPQKTDCAFLELPGEIRNHIYAMAIYPELSSIVIVNCTKPEHLGLQTAIVFFSCAGPATSEIKALTLVQPAMSILESKESRDTVEHFFAALNRMEDLNELVLEDIGRNPMLEQSGKELEFVRRVKDLSKRGLDVKVRFGKERVV